VVEDLVGCNEVAPMLGTVVLATPPVVVLGLMVVYILIMLMLMVDKQVCTETGEKEELGMLLTQQQVELELEVEE
jgi:hypothetical protein